LVLSIEPGIRDARSLTQRSLRSGYAVSPVRFAIRAPRKPPSEPAVAARVFAVDFSAVDTANLFATFKAAKLENPFKETVRDFKRFASASGAEKFKDALPGFKMKRT
jgi:hypothetical protein